MIKIVTGSRRNDMMVQGVRDLFAAGWLGEQAFAHLGLHRAVSVLADPRERSKVIGQSWKSERPFGRAIEVGLASVALVDLVRDARKGRWFDLAASACALGAVGTAIASEISGSRIGSSTPIETAFTPHSDAPRSARTAQTALKFLAPIGLGFAAASIALSIVSRSCDD
jgi:hypothetical protein